MICSKKKKVKSIMQKCIEDKSCPFIKIEMAWWLSEYKKMYMVKK